MKFKINSNQFKETLKKVKNSKALDKTDESLSAILLEATSDGSLKIIAHNNAFWSRVELTKKDFEDCEEGADANFSIDEVGKVFVTGNNFIDIVNSYPKDVVLNAQLKHSKTKNKGEYLNVRYKAPTGKSATTDFMSCKVKYFEEKPLEEKRQKITVPADKFIDAVDAVAFAVQVQAMDEAEQHLFGCRLEIYDTYVCSSATNKKRICLYGEDEEEDPNYILNPMANMLEPVLKNLDRNKDICLGYGEKTTMVEQGNQSYCIPNVLEIDKIPDCRNIVKAKQGQQTVKIRIDKKELQRRLKAIALTAGKQFGMAISIDTENHSMCLSSKKLDESGMIKAIHEEVDPIRDTEIQLLNGKHFKENILVNIEFFQDVLNKFADDHFWISFGDKDTVFFEDKGSDIRYLLCRLEEVG